MPHFLEGPLAEDPAGVAVGVHPRKRAVEAHGVLEVREAVRVEAPSVLWQVSSLMACMAVIVASLPLFGMSSMSMRIRGRLSRWWKFGAAHSTSFGEPNTSSYRYWIAYLRRLAEPELGGSRGPTSSRSQVIERIAPVLEPRGVANACRPLGPCHPSSDEEEAPVGRRGRSRVHS